MNLAETRGKFEEAKFFLGCLKRAQDEQERERPEVFLYYFSAFLSASDSVRNYAQSEVIRTLSLDAIARRRRTSRERIRNSFRDSLKGWVGALPPKSQGLWRVLRVQRGKEVHAERTKTWPQQKEMPVHNFLSDRGYAERARNFAAYYVQQQVMAYYPDVLPGVKDMLGLPSGATVTRYVQEHHIEIEGFDRAVLTICEEYIQLLDGFVRHFEQSAP